VSLKNNAFDNKSSSIYSTTTNLYPIRHLNRKCLSRVNLNLYQHQKHQQQSTNNDESAAVVLKKKPTTTTTNFAARTKTKPNSSVSIMNLDRLTTTMTNKSTNSSELNANNDQTFHTSSSSNHLLTTPMYQQPPSSASSAQFAGYLRTAISNRNLFKSSTSLNALDLELLESVSVGSFDRESLYSFYANSECCCELSNYCLYDPSLVYNNHKNNNCSILAAKNLANKSFTNISASAAEAAAVDDNTADFNANIDSKLASIKLNSNNNNNKAANSKVIDWLQHI
jgi:hypothetical protein